jgi:hypothetical protein
VPVSAGRSVLLDRQRQQLLARGADLDRRVHGRATGHCKGSNLLREHPRSATPSRVNQVACAVGTRSPGHRESSVMADRRHARPAHQDGAPHTVMLPV